LTVGRQQIKFCTAYRCYWMGLLIPWAKPFAETDEAQRREWNEAGLENYEPVTPWILGTTGSHPLAGRTLGEIAAAAEMQKPKT
jgi:hypothetical protein